MAPDSDILAARKASDLEPDSSPEVLVIGAGPVGLFAALLLADRGFEVTIADQERRPAARSYALALHPHTLRLLEGAGLAAEALAQAHRIERIVFYEGKDRQAEIDLGAVSDFPCIAVLPQQILEGMLESRLEELGVRVLWNHRLAELHLGSGPPQAFLERLRRTPSNGGDEAVAEETFEVRPEMVIGADGHHSAVRHALKASFVEMSPPEVFAVFETGAEQLADAEARILLDADGAGVLWPLGGHRLRWSFQVPDWEGFVEPRFKRRVFPKVGDEPFPYLVRERLDELVAARAPWFEAPAGDVIWSMAVRFEHRLAGRFGQGHAWLAGDAAHLASPVGAQSMNIGLKEAHELVRLVEWVQRDGYPLDLFERYEKERRHEWRQLFGARGRPEPAPAAGAWVRHHAARILPCLPASGPDLSLLLRQIGLELPAA